MLLTFTGEAMSTAERYDEYRQGRWCGPSVRMHPAWIVLLILGFIVWWNFLVGHILNNVRGFGS